MRRSSRDVSLVVGFFRSWEVLGRCVEFSGELPYGAVCSYGVTGQAKCRMGRE